MRLLHICFRGRVTVAKSPSSSDVHSTIWLLHRFTLASLDEDTNQEKAEGEKVNMDVKSENVDETVKGEKKENAKETVNVNTKLEDEKKKTPKVDTKKKETPVMFDKKLLQDIRFFDKNRVGYIKVEDLRLILHTLGKCMSHRDVKELVQNALLESNSGRDDRILYNKLVRMTDI